MRGSGTTDQCKTSCRLKLLMAFYFSADKEPTCRSSNHKGLLARYNIVVLGGVAKKWSRKTPSLVKPKRLVQLKSRENLKSWATRDREDVSSRERENEIYIVIVKFSTKENVSHQRLCDSNTIKSTTTREIFSHQRELKASHQSALWRTPYLSITLLTPDLNGYSEKGIIVPEGKGKVILKY